MNNFEYNYRAPTAEERRHIESIRSQYAQKPDMALLEQLKQLDKKVRTIPTIWAVITGVIGVLVMGLGMTMVMEWDIPVGGIVVGVIGLILTALALPLYKCLLKSYKAKYGGEIVKLADMLLDDNKENKTNGN